MFRGYRDFAPDIILCCYVTILEGKTDNSGIEYVTMHYAYRRWFSFPSSKTDSCVAMGNASSLQNLRVIDRVYVIQFTALYIYKSTDDAVSSPALVYILVGLCFVFVYLFSGLYSIEIFAGSREDGDSYIKLKLVQTHF